MVRTFIVKDATTLEALGPSLLDARFPAAQQDAALTQLKTLNPHADPQKLAAGTVLFVPDSPGFKTTAAATVQAGVLQDFQALLAAALAAVAPDIRTGMATRAAERADVSTVLQSAAFTRLAGGDTVLKQQADDGLKALVAEEKDDKQAEQDFAAIGKAATETLGRLAKLLG